MASGMQLTSINMPAEPPLTLLMTYAPSSSSRSSMALMSRALSLASSGSHVLYIASSASDLEKVPGVVALAQSQQNFSANHDVLERIHVKYCPQQGDLQKIAAALHMMNTQQPIRHILVDNLHACVLGRAPAGSNNSNMQRDVALFKAVALLRDAASHMRASLIATHCTQNEGTAAGPIENGFSKRVVIA